MKVEIISIKSIPRWKFWRDGNREVTVEINGEKRTVDIDYYLWVSNFMFICRLKCRLLGLSQENYSIHHEYRLLKNWFRELKNFVGFVFEI